MFDDDKPALPKPAYMIGQNIATMSIEELAATVESLKAEIGRLQQAIDGKRAASAAAESIFRKG